MSARTFAEHYAETIPLEELQTVQFQAFLSAMRQDGEDTSALVWADAVTAGWDRISHLQALQIIVKALR